VDIERAVISKIIATGQLELAVSKGIRIEHFEDPECRDITAPTLTDFDEDHLPRLQAQTP